MTRKNISPWKANQGDGTFLVHGAKIRRLLNEVSKKIYWCRPITTWEPTFQSTAVVWAILFSCLAPVARADPALKMLDDYRKQAKAEAPAFTDFSADRGRRFFVQKQPVKTGEMSCATCHTSDPRNIGRTRANKDIEPLAPSANGKRFTDPAKVEKWFRRNCDDVLGRQCTPVEKGDFITYLINVK